MAGLLKAIENGYKPTPREIVAELEETCNVSSYNSWSAKSANTGSIHREEFVSKLLKLLGVSQ